VPGQNWINCFFKSGLGSSLINTVGFQVWKTDTHTKQKYNLWASIVIPLWENHFEKNLEFFLIILKGGLLLEELILTKVVCYWVFSSTGLSFCINQGVFLNLSWTCLIQDLCCVHCNSMKFLNNCIGFGL